MQNIEYKRKPDENSAWERPGQHITFFLPGMFRLNGHTGRYPAVSITGGDCALGCDHCRGTILSNMLKADDPDRLPAVCRRLANQGHVGVLISGGCGPDGTIPWSGFFEAIRKIKSSTGLFVSIHSGLVDLKTARSLKNAGVDQALIDVIGDDATFRSVYRLPFGVDEIARSMEALQAVGIPIVPHIVCGIDHGRIHGEYQAVETAARFNIAQLVVVSLMPIPGTPMARVKPPSAEQTADIISEARSRMPDIPISLGCARKRGDHRLEELALDAGVTRMALPSEEAVQHARDRGLQVRFQPTCCSVPPMLYTDGWL